MTFTTNRTQTVPVYFYYDLKLQKMIFSTHLHANLFIQLYSFQITKEDVYFMSKTIGKMSRKHRL